MTTKVILSRLPFNAIISILFTLVACSVILGQDENIIPQRMIYLGGADGKHYFAEKTVPRNWTEASDYCKSLNMELASIQTESHSELLVSAGNTHGLVFPLEFWTAAREARYFHTAFRWNDTSELVNITSWRWIPARFSDLPYSVCATYTVQAIYSAMSSIQCSEVINGTLCQKIKNED